MFFELKYLWATICLLLVTSLVGISCVDDPVKPQSESEREDDQVVDMSGMVSSDAAILDVAVEPDMTVDAEIQSCMADGDCAEGVCDGGECVIECSAASDCSGRFDDCRSGRFAPLVQLADSRLRHADDLTDFPQGQIFVVVHDHDETFLFR